MDHKLYQYEGVEWCIKNERSGLGGGIVADEMGLGKTVTMIGTFLENFLQRTLIILPVALVDQWVSQLYKITGHRAVVYHGAKKDIVAVAKAPIVVTTYGMITVNRKLIVPNALHKIRWNRLVFDEAHHLRNSRTGRHIGAGLLQADVRWFVTGTPVQNRLRDMYSICSLYSNIVKDPNDVPILRRTKKSAGILIPDVVSKYVNVSWKDSREKEFAEEVHSALSFSEVSMDKFRAVAQGMSNEERESTRNLMMFCFAKQLCTLPLLLSPKLRKLMADGIIGDDHIYIGALNESSKLDEVVLTILDRKGNGNGKLIFCQFRLEMDKIAERLRAEGMVVGIMDGRTKIKDRKDICLSGKYDVVILQIQTGCEGLNLQDHFSEVYFASPHWNPAVEDQAIARCHRFGQTKPVFVYRFAMKGFEVKESDRLGLSLDEYVSAIQDKKREIMIV